MYFMVEYLCRHKQWRKALGGKDKIKALQIDFGGDNLAVLKKQLGKIDKNMNPDMIKEKILRAAEGTQATDNAKNLDYTSGRVTSYILDKDGSLLNAEIIYEKAKK